MAFGTTAIESAGIEPTSDRDPVAFLLFFRMSWCESRPGLMFAAMGVLIIAGSLLEKVLP